VTQSDVQDKRSAATSRCMQMTQLQYEVISEKPSVLARVRPVMIALDSGCCPMAEWIISVDEWRQGVEVHYQALLHEVWCLSARRVQRARHTRNFTEADMGEQGGRWPCSKP